MDLNPLDTPGTVFDLELLNPNPTSSKTVDGPKYRVSFEIDRESWQCFMDANTKGMIIAAKAVVVGDPEDHAEIETARPEKGPWGKEAAMLKRSGFFRSPDVWQWLGTDADYLKWVRQQKCAVCGTTQSIEAAHVRRIADGAGTGIKPAWSAISLCSDHHAAQHNYGETAIGGKEEVNRMRILHVERWAWERFREIMEVDSMTKLDPDIIIAWAKWRGVERYLPRGYGLGV